MRRTMMVAAVFIGISLAAVAVEADQLYSNGALASVPGGGAGGMDASRLQTNLGMRTLGLGIDFASGTLRAVADDFTVPAPGWNLTRITVYGYQSNSGFQSTLNDLRLLIMNGPPSGPAAVVYGNPAVNVLASTSFTNVFRDNQGSPGIQRAPHHVRVRERERVPAARHLLAGMGARRSIDEWPVRAANHHPRAAHHRQWALVQRGLGTGARCRDEHATRASVHDRGEPARRDGPRAFADGCDQRHDVPAREPVRDYRNADGRLESGRCLRGLRFPGGATLSLTPGGIVPGVVPYTRGFRPFNFSGTLLSMPMPAAPPGSSTPASLPGRARHDESGELAESGHFHGYPVSWTRATQRVATLRRRRTGRHLLQCGLPCATCEFDGKRARHHRQPPGAMPRSQR